jgi:hypothetical protein
MSRIIVAYGIRQRIIRLARRLILDLLFIPINAFQRSILQIELWAEAWLWRSQASRHGGWKLLAIRDHDNDVRSLNASSQPMLKYHRSANRSPREGYLSNES